MDQTNWAAENEILNVDHEAERAVLGAYLADELTASLQTSELRPEDFGEEFHRSVFAAMRRLQADGKPIDTITLADEMKRVGLDVRASQLVDLEGITAANAGHHAKIVKEKAMARDLLGTLAEAEHGAWQGGSVKSLIDKTAARLGEIAQADGSVGPKTAKEAVATTLQEFEKRYKNRGTLQGITSGLRSVDEMLGGFKPGDLVVLAARPSMGKTALALQMAFDAATLGKKVLVFSLEMTREQLCSRLVSRLSRVDSARINTGMFTDADWPRLTRACNEVSNSSLFIDDGGVTAVDVRARARQVQRTHGLDMVVIDYLQLMNTTDRRSQRERQIAEISASLKQLAKELRIPVLCLSQLNRGVEARNDKRPLLADLRESGAIEQDADMVLMLYRDEYYNPDNTESPGEAELLVRKNRNGRVGQVGLGWQSTFTAFRDFDTPRAEGGAR